MEWILLPRDWSFPVARLRVSIVSLSGSAGVGAEQGVARGCFAASATAIDEGLGGSRGGGAEFSAAQEGHAVCSGASGAVLVCSAAGAEYARRGNSVPHARSAGGA